MTVDGASTQCVNCGSTELSKLVSRVGRFRKEEARISEMADRLESMDEPDSSVEMRKMVREMGSALDEDAADEMEELFESDVAEPDEQGS